MLDLEKTANNRVYKTELLGDTLVVELQGDAPGFSIGAVHNEMTTVIGLAKSPEVRNLVIDMSGSNYYGSLILGEVVNLAQAIREKGGRVALAGVSNDMKEVLRMMRLDAMWERYPYRSMALRALTKVPWQYYVKPYLKPAAFVGGAVLLLAVIFFLPRPDHTREYYAQISKLWEEAQHLRNQGVSDTEWSIFTKKTKERLAHYAARLEKVTNNEGSRMLLYAVRDHAPKALDRRLNPADEDTIAVSYYLACCKAYLEHSEMPVLPKELEGGAVIPYGPVGSGPPALPRAAAPPPK